MKTKIICVLCCTVVAFLAATACGTSDGSTEKASSSNDVSSNETISVIDSELDNKLLANKKNTAGNGYIIINDENDYPECIKEIRYIEEIDSDLYSIKDFWGNEIFILESTSFPYFKDGVSNFTQNGKIGFVDINGKIIIEAQYDMAGSFFNGTSIVVKDGNEFYIDKTGNKADNKRLQGFEGSLDALKKELGDNLKYTVFTGQYMLCTVIPQSDNEEAVIGYADKKGKFTQINNIFNGYQFYNGYAAVENKDGELYFIDENFHRVTGNIYDICNDEFVPIDFLDNFTGTEYVFKGGYFISTLKSDDSLGERKVIKIAPELYEED